LEGFEKKMGVCFEVQLASIRMEKCGREKWYACGCWPFLLEDVLKYVARKKGDLAAPSGENKGITQYRNSFVDSTILFDFSLAASWMAF
jgi:hypothetical protein